ncbi:hypothetical protein [Algoriphagus boritolerans]|uniref:hypothetical protein n=1 Tax=Algoriphagus boritolerans TaxID=308111 RepID=UPI002FCDE701
MKAKLNVVIVEDEFHSRETLKSFLKEYCPEVDVKDTAATVMKLLKRSLNSDQSLFLWILNSRPGLGLMYFKKSDTWIFT